MDFDYLKADWRRLKGVIKTLIKFVPIQTINGVLSVKQLSIKGFFNIKFRGGFRGVLEAY